MLFKIAHCTGCIVHADSAVINDEALVLHGKDMDLCNLETWGPCDVVVSSTTEDPRHSELMEEPWEQQVKFFAKVIQIMGVAPQ